MIRIHQNFRPYKKSSHESSDKKILGKRTSSFTSSVWSISNFGYHDDSLKKVIYTLINYDEKNLWKKSQRKKRYRSWGNMSLSSRPPPKKPTLALDVNVVQDNMPQEVVPRVFIGSIHASFNQDALSSLKITHVRRISRYLCCSFLFLLTDFLYCFHCLQIINASRLPATFPKLFTYLSVDLRDK